MEIDDLKKYIELEDGTVMLSHYENGELRHYEYNAEGDLCVVLEKMQKMLIKGKTRETMSLVMQKIVKTYE